MHIEIYNCVYMHASMHARTQKQTHTHTHTHTSSHPHISCVFHVRQSFSSFSSVWRGSAGLMTFPMRHKQCMWEASSRTARVCMWESLCIYVWVCEGLDTCEICYSFVKGFMCISPVCFRETSQKVCERFWNKVIHVLVFTGSVHT